MLMAKLFFDDLYEEYKASGLFSFEKLNRWIGTETNQGSLWNLKEDSHLLFRTNSSSSFYERVFDWTLGSIFHGGMKLKENVYLLEVYQKEGKAFTESRNIPEDLNIEALLEEYQVTFTKARDSAVDEVENLRYLFSKAMEHLQRLICANKHEGLLIRFLIENQEMYDRVYDGAGALLELLNSMYKQGVQDAFLLAARDYRRGGWHGKALVLLKKALALGTENGALKAECEELEKMLTME